MGKLSDFLGTLSNQFQIGIGGTGLRRLRFRNGFNGDLEWEPTANRTIALPDESGTIALLPTRRVGITYGYTGWFGSGQGWFDDCDGKWVYLSLDSCRTIGSAASGADIAADWLQNLFIHLWLQYSNTSCPILNASGTPTTRGGVAFEDFNANKRLTLPDYRGRVIGMAGTGNGLTLRDKNTIAGAETHALAVAEMPAHSHTINNVSSLNSGGSQFGGSSSSTSPQATTNSTGGGASHNNMQPTAFENWVIAAGAR